jgi:hypothetical protein
MTDRLTLTHRLADLRAVPLLALAMCLTSGPAEAAFKIYLSRETALTAIILYNASMMVGVGVYFYKKNFAGGIVLLVIALLPWVIIWLLAIAGVSMRRYY